MKKRLYRSESQKKIAGVCGGLAEYFDVDVTVVRILAVILAFTASSGIWLYLAAALIMPTQSEVQE